MNSTGPVAFYAFSVTGVGLLLVVLTLAALLWLAVWPAVRIAGLLGRFVEKRVDRS